RRDQLLQALRRMHRDLSREALPRGSVRREVGRRGGGGVMSTIPESLIHVTPLSGPSGERFDGAIDLERVRAAHPEWKTAREVVTADGNTAAAYATLQMWRCVLFAGFPITPSTKWIETVAARLAQDPGIRKVKLLEAEHAVADYLVGAAASCRDLIFPTATSSVGLDHMTETPRSLGASGPGNRLIDHAYS